VIITASAVNRGPKRVDLKAIVDEACQKAAAAGYRDVNKILVFEKSALPRWVGLSALNLHLCALMGVEGAVP
jgi:hypothetical protein